MLPTSHASSSSHIPGVAVDPSKEAKKSLKDVESMIIVTEYHLSNLAQMHNKMCRKLKIREMSLEKPQIQAQKPEAALVTVQMTTLNLDALSKSERKIEEIKQKILQQGTFLREICVIHNEICNELKSWATVNPAHLKPREEDSYSSDSEEEVKEEKQQAHPFPFPKRQKRKKQPVVTIPEKNWPFGP